ncbi:MAG: hypothetical protein LQ351_003342 [Letrouitia transgressa]|nr:MAG: hypothetical protein LQ351_003342 [Letrouitia transgressa]
MTVPGIVVPGQLLGLSSIYIPGPGTHLIASKVYASLAGRPNITPLLSGNQDPKSSPSRSIISVPRLSSAAFNHPVTSPNVSNSNILPTVGSIVIGRVIRLMTRQVNVAILIVWGESREEQVCGDELQGVIRREDVRATEKEKVVVGEGFRVGDIVRGTVISLGDQHNYYLSTAKNEYGVIIAKSEVGNTMFPISWKEFRDPVTGLTETRKAAKPV